MLFKNILVPHDGSGHSKHAFKVALDMAKKYNSKISMVTVLDTSTGLWVLQTMTIDTNCLLGNHANYC